MGIYIFNARYLYKELERDINDPNSSHDFGKDVIPHMLANGYKVFAHRFRDRNAKARIAAAYRGAFDYHCKLNMPADPISRQEKAASEPHL